MQGTFFRTRLPFLLGVVVLVGLMRGSSALANSQAQTPDQRALAIVAQMTLDEKILELHGVGGPSPNLRIVPAIPRLGIPAFVITNGLAGVSYGTINPRTPATALPAPLALAASWDTTLASAYGTVIGQEAKILGNDLVEGPDMNLARIPQNGRTFENLGECSKGSRSSHWPQDKPGTPRLSWVNAPSSTGIPASTTGRSFRAAIDRGWILLA